MTLKEFTQEWEKASADTQHIVRTMAAYLFFKHQIDFPKGLEESDNVLDYFPYLPPDLQKELGYFLMFTQLRAEEDHWENEEQEHEWEIKYILVQRSVNPNPEYVSWEELENEIEEKLKQYEDE
jgi:hypothetical protein